MIVLYGFIITITGSGSIATWTKGAVYYNGEIVKDFFANLVVNNLVILELKACEVLVKAHSAQTLNYLRATNIEIALLLNFGEKPEINRFIFTNNRK